MALIIVGWFAIMLFGPKFGIAILIVYMCSLLIVYLSHLIYLICTTTASVHRRDCLVYDERTKQYQVKSRK